MVTAVILAAGRGSRFGEDKVWAELEGAPVWLHAYRTFRAYPEVDAVGLVVAAGREPEARALAPEAAFVVAGGEDRQASAQAGVEASADGLVLLHDGARPWISAEVIQRVIEACRQTGAAAACVPVTDTVRQGNALIPRDELRAMQTPQGGRREDLLRAYAALEGTTDDAAALQAIGLAVEFVPGDPANQKITYMNDMPSLPEYRTGLGYDIHRFSEDKSRTLWLGGVEFPIEPALDGHSDADVLLHAVVDALLGAAALGDIGVHFPNTDERWRGAPSIDFVKFAKTILFEAGWRIVNVDATVVAEFPKVMRRATEIRETIAAALEISADRVSVKATTNEKMGSVGRAEGIAAFATATLVRQG